MLHKTIARNPSLLCENGYDIEGIIAQYEELGVSKRDLVHADFAAGDHYKDFL